MKIDGKSIAQDIFQNLKQKITLLKEKNIVPHIVIILIGENPASVSYVKRKQLKAEEIGARATVMNYELPITNEELLRKITELNNDTTVQGIIIQRPLPKHINTDAINQAVTPLKDIDAFHKDTPFAMPLAKAVLLLLLHVYQQSTHEETFTTWLKTKHIVVLGKGETGGGPIINLLQQQGILPSIIDSKTKNITEMTKKADVIISAVGREQVITPSMIKNDVILISVGQHKQKDGKFHGDYEEDTIVPIASFYSPTPGGVGPVNVACLLQNLIQATMKQHNIDNN